MPQSHSVNRFPKRALSQLWGRVWRECGKRQNAAVPKCEQVPKTSVSETDNVSEEILMLLIHLFIRVHSFNITNNICKGISHHAILDVRPDLVIREQSVEV
jgi:hypothetical protein